MSNIIKEDLYIYPPIGATYEKNVLTIKAHNQVFTYKFPVSSHVYIESNFLRIQINRNLGVYYSCILRKIAVLLRGLYKSHIIELKFVGTGYKAFIENDEIVLKLGYSHKVSVQVPKILTINFIKYNHFQIVSMNYEIIIQFVYDIKKFRKPEPFTGKGVLIVGEKIIRKEGKKKFI